jgi:hypothetical protein
VGITLKYKWRKKINWQILSADFICGALLLVFLYTAWSKLMDYEQFRYTLSQSVLLKPLAGIIAWLLPVTEFAIAVLLFIPAFRRIGLWVSATVITAFTIYLGYMILYMPKLPCTCGGVLAELSWRQHIVFNLSLIVLSVTSILLYNKHKGMMNKSPPKKQ